MPAMAARSKVADSRRPRAAGLVISSFPSVTGAVLAGEVVEGAAGAVAAELRRVVGQARVGQQLGELGAVLVAHRLLDAVRAEAPDAAADVEARLVDRVAEAVARVAADDHPAGLGHERAHRPDG